MISSKENCKEEIAMETSDIMSFQSCCLIPGWFLHPFASFSADINRSMNKSKETYFVLLTIAEGIGPKVASIIARCSLLSCVYKQNG